MKVFVTGASGFIAKHIVKELLNRGHFVTGSLRNLDRVDEVRDAVKPHLSDPAGLDRLAFASLDLTSDEGWDTALAGHEALLHTASPFPIKQPKIDDEVIRPAVEGTARALKAATAAGVSRVVLTSSTEAIVHGDKTAAITEADWSDLNADTVTAYTRSKTEAERAAWDYAGAHPEMKLTAINPGLVLGRPLDRHYGSSVSIVERMMSGRDPMVPDISFPVVDVDDVAWMHAAALERPESIGKRYIAADRFVTLQEVARVLGSKYPDRKISTRLAPRWIISLLALFDAEVKAVRPWQGKHYRLSHALAESDLGVRFIPAPTAILSTAAALEGFERSRA